MGEVVMEDGAWGFRVGVMFNSFIYRGLHATGEVIGDIYPPPHSWRNDNGSKTTVHQTYYPPENSA